MKSLFYVGLGGAVGSILRYLTSVITQKYYPGSFPLGTFIVNLIGCYVIGLLLGYFSKTPENQALKLLLVTGICGGFTTFSAFSAESMQLIQNNQTNLAITYIVCSVIMGLGATFTGFLSFR